MDSRRQQVPQNLDHFSKHLRRWRLSYRQFWEIPLSLALRYPRNRDAIELATINTSQKSKGGQPQAQTWHILRGCEAPTHSLLTQLLWPTTEPSLWIHVDHPTQSSPAAWQLHNHTLPFSSNQYKKTSFQTSLLWTLAWESLAPILKVTMKLLQYPLRQSLPAKPLCLSRHDNMSY